MNDFKFMDKTVEEICMSMLLEPDDWSVEVHIVKHLKTGNQLWHSNTTSIREVWTGKSTEEVFSKEQGVKIYKAFCLLREIKSSQNQQKLIDAFEQKEVKSKPNRWWELWK